MFQLKNVITFKNNDKFLKSFEFYSIGTSLYIKDKYISKNIFI